MTSPAALLPTIILASVASIGTIALGLTVYIFRLLLQVSYSGRLLHLSSLYTLNQAGQILQGQRESRLNKYIRKIVVDSAIGLTCTHLTLCSQFLTLELFGRQK